MDGIKIDRFLFGLHFTFDTPSYCIGDGCKYTVNISKQCKWNDPDDRYEAIVDNVEKINKILDDARCNYVSELKNKPVEIIVEENLFKDFRILTEVL